MNDQSQMMNQHQAKSHSQFSLTKQSSQTMNQSQMIMSHSQMLNQLPNQTQIVNQQLPQMLPSQAQMVNQQPLMLSQASNPMIAQPQLVNQSKMMGQNSKGQWSQPPHSMPRPPMKLPNPNPNPMYQMYGGMLKSGHGGNWKGKKPMDKRKDGRRRDKGMVGGIGAGGAAVTGPGIGGYKPPSLYELEQQNRLKARKFYHPKKKFNRMGPYAHAPRNTTSYLIRAKKSGGIASLVSPCPVTPAVLPTPVFSPSREALVDMAKEEWGVDGYGSMKGLIRLRSPGHDETVDDYEEEDEGGSSESDVEEHVEVERRLDHDLSRFEMIYPNSGVDYHNVLENRVDDQDTHIAQLEEENLILKERLYLMEREFGELRRRLLCLERQNQVVEDINEEVEENVSENDSEGLRNIPLLGNKHNEEVDYVPRNEAGESGENRNDSEEILHRELRELAVKEVFHGKALEKTCKDVALGEHKRDIALVNEGVVVDLMVDKKDELLGEEQVQGVGVEWQEHQVSEGNKVVGSALLGGPQEERNDETLNSEETGDFPMREAQGVGSAIGPKVGSVDQGVKSQPLGDACMAGMVTGKADESESDRLGGLSEETGANLKHDQVIIGGAREEHNDKTLNNEETGDVSMGDALLMGKRVNND